MYHVDGARWWNTEPVTGADTLGECSLDVEGQKRWKMKDSIICGEECPELFSRQ